MRTKTSKGWRTSTQLTVIDVLIFFTDFRARTSVLVSDDDLEHICKHVRSCEETVNPILRALYSSDRQGRRPIFSTRNSFEDDLRMIKRWKSGLVTERVTFCSGSEEIPIQVTNDDEMTPMYPGSREVSLEVITSPPNQMIRLCLALEEAGKTVDVRHRPIYLKLAKTFFKSKIYYLVFNLESGNSYSSV